MGAKPSAARADTAVQASTGLPGIDLDVPCVPGRGMAGSVVNDVSPPLAAQGTYSITSGRSLAYKLASDDIS